MNAELQDKSDGFLGRRPRWIRWGFFFCVWTLLGLSFAVSTYLGALQNGAQISWKRALSGYLADFYLWGMLSPLIFLVARRFELRHHFPRNLLIHISLSILLSGLVLSAASPLVWYLGYVNLTLNPTLFTLWRNNAFSIYYFHQGLTIYWTTVVVAHSLYYYRRVREEEARTGQLATQLAQAQLQALKMQIHPHFLFNTLNSIAALLHKDVEAADKMIARLGDFLRLTLTRSDEQTLDFDQELGFLKCYLDIEHIRFQDRLTVEMDIDPETLNVIVPNLILQPIVENAIEHGISAQCEGSTITIKADIEHDELHLLVSDSGPGFKFEHRTRPSRPANGNGIGLANTRQRLDQLYGARHLIEYGPSPSGGASVAIHIPFEPAPLQVLKETA